MRVSSLHVRNDRLYVVGQSVSVAGTFRQTLANAVVLSSVSLNVARVLGSVIGGTLVAAVGIPVCFLINAASFIAVVISLVRMHAEDMLPAVHAPRARGHLRDGLRYALGTPGLMLPLLTITGILAYESPTALPLLATGAFHGTAAAYGLMAGVMALWAFVGGGPTVVLGLLVRSLVRHRDQIAAVPDDQSDESDACPEVGAPNAA